MKKQIKTCLIVLFAIMFTICLTMFAACVDYIDSVPNNSSSSVITDNSSDNSDENSSIEDSSIEDSSIGDSSAGDSSIDDSSIEDSSSGNDSSSGKEDSSSDDPVCEHEWQDATCIKPQTCAKCGQTLGLANGHTAGEWVIDYESTCGAQGAKHKECTVCGAIAESEVIPALGHSYVQSEYVTATCEKDGYIIYTCANNCEATKRQTLVSTGHSFNANNVCIKCGYKPVNHTHNFTTTTVDATCVTIGYTQYTCSCGYSYKADYMPELGHRFNDGEVTKQATCTVNGEIKYSCERCTQSYTTVLFASHDFVENIITAATCKTDGLTERTCNNCQEKQTIVIKAAHSFNQGTVITAATCTSGEVKQVTCTVCGHSEQVTDKELGHNFKDGKCTRCDATIPDIVTPDNTQLKYGMYFKIDDIISNYGPDYINEYGVMLDYNSGATIKKVAVYLTQEGQMWRRAIACVGEGITYATYVPYLSYNDQIKYTGLNSDWINTFSLSLNANGVWCYSDYATIGVNLEDNKGNLLLSLYDIGQAGLLTRIFTDLNEMKAWLQQDLVCDHLSSDWIIDEEATCEKAGAKHKECTLCCAIIQSATISAKGHNYGEWQITFAADCENAGAKHKDCQNDGCGSRIEQAITALGHSYGAWVSNGDGTHTKTCSLDSSHTLTENCSGGSATCTKQATCTLCGEKYGSKVNHSYTNYIYDNNATCEEDGTQTAQCDYGCGKTNTITKPSTAFGHDYCDWIIDEEATCEKAGAKHKDCQNDGCGSRIEQAITALGHNYVNGVC